MALVGQPTVRTARPCRLRLFVCARPRRFELRTTLSSLHWKRLVRSLEQLRIEQLYSKQLCTEHLCTSKLYSAAVYCAVACRAVVCCPFFNRFNGRSGSL